VAKSPEHSPTFGKHHSEATRKKISDHHADISGDKNPSKRLDVAKKISTSMMGHKMSEETRQKMLKTFKARGVSQGKNNPMYGRIGEKSPMYGRIGTAHPLYGHTGKETPNWQGGVSFEPYCPKFNDEFKERVRAFFDYSCICCGKTEIELNRKLCVHHVSYDKSTCCNDRIPRFTVVCIKHNVKANYDRARWEYMFNYIISEIYHGKCYYTREEFTGLQE